MPVVTVEFRPGRSDAQKRHVGMRHVEVAGPSDIKRQELGNLIGRAAWDDRRDASAGVR
jgi:hypothetical protein